MATKPRSRRHTHFTFTVKAQREWTFPTDMLRYDTCWPADQDNVLIMHSVIVGDRAKLKGIVRVTLTGTQRPTAARWKSFGWNVVGEVVEKEFTTES